MVIVTIHQYVQHTTVGTSAVGLSRIERKRRVRRSEHQKRCAKGENGDNHHYYYHTVIADGTATATHMHTSYVCLSIKLRTKGNATRKTWIHPTCLPGRPSYMKTRPTMPIHGITTTRARHVDRGPELSTLP
jgi:hypothetical protein